MTPEPNFKIEYEIALIMLLLALIYLSTRMAR